MRVKGYCALRLVANKFRKVLSTTRSEAFASLSLWKTPAPVIMPGPNINICILSSDCCHVFGWEACFEGGPTLPWVDWFPNRLVSSQMGTLSIPWAARRGFVKCLSNGGPTLRSKIQVHFTEIRAFQPNERNCWRHKGSRGWKLYQSNFIFIGSTHTWYLSFFLHEQNFWKIKFTPKFTVYIANVHSKLPIYTVKCQFTQ